MKWLIILGIIITVGAIIALRFRRQIQMAIYVWRMFRKMRRAGETDEKQIETKENARNVPLVRCAKCGSWGSKKNALNLRSGTYYCSADCMEQSVKV